MYTIVENQGEKLGCTGSRAAEEQNDGLTSPGQMHNHNAHGSTGAAVILMTNAAAIMMVLVSSFLLAFSNAGPS